MRSEITFLGEHPFARDERGALKSRIATVFPRRRAIVTLPGMHVSQRQAFLEHLDRERAGEGSGPFSRRERDSAWSEAVDLVVEEEALLIRPDPGNMPLAFLADELLQEIVPKQDIRFLGVLNESVRNAIKSRGELWRITPLPKSPEEMGKMIQDSRTAIGGRGIYYYSKTTGSRLLTFAQFAGLGSLDDDGLRSALAEIREFSTKANALGNPEIAFLVSEPRLARSEVARRDFRAMDPAGVRAAFAELSGAFLGSTRPELRVDDPGNVEWRNALVSALLGKEHEVISGETLAGLSPEFFMQIEWLPGGRIEEGELLFDRVEEKGQAGDENPQKFLFNLAQEFGDLEHVNFGRVTGSLSRRPSLHGRRGVYISVVKRRRIPEESVSIIRLQKQGVREFLGQGYSRMDAMVRSEEYTEYTLDRWLGCRQLGMRLPLRIAAKRFSESYLSPAGERFTIWTPYYVRDYVRGMATDKLPPARFESRDFARAFARLLGWAAAPNMVVGRCELTGKPFFDDGDEVLVFGDTGMPVDILVSDITGSFNDSTTPLEDFAASYAVPVNCRLGQVRDPQEFAAGYLDAFSESFARIQEDYRGHREAFDSLFAQRPGLEEAGFSHRWAHVLSRMERTDPRELLALVRRGLEIS